jgi:hypothetical protein
MELWLAGKRAWLVVDRIIAGSPQKITRQMKPQTIKELNSALFQT